MKEKEFVYVLTVDDVSIGNIYQCAYVFRNKKDAQDRMQELIDNLDKSSIPDIVEERDEESYLAYVDGDYPTNHYGLQIFHEEII